MYAPMQKNVPIHTSQQNVKVVHPAGTAEPGSHVHHCQFPTRRRQPASAGLCAPVAVFRRSSDGCSPVSMGVAVSGDGPAAPLSGRGHSFSPVTVAGPGRLPLGTEALSGL